MRNRTTPVHWLSQWHPQSSRTSGAMARAYQRFICLTSLALCAWLLLSGASVAVAQMTDSFEGGAPRWQLVESDCAAQLTLQELSVTFPRSGQTSELLEVAVGNGTFVYLAYPIEPCVVLNEFEPRLWTRCASSGLRYGVRVIFPMANHPVTGGRLTTILWGDTYSTSGQWQMLKISEMEKLLQAEIISLRQRFGPDLVLENPLIDACVLNVYTGSGRYRLQIDDMNLQGHIALPAVGRSIPSNWRETWRWRTESLNPEGRFWTSLNRPEVWLQYQGESLPWLKSLGVSGLVVGKVPSEEQLRAIHDAKLTVVCPPPQYSLALDPKNSTAIRGWLIGAALDAAQADRAQEQVTRVAQFSDALKRPVFGEALEQYWMFSRIADEVIVPVPDNMSAGSILEQENWLRSQLAITLQRGQGWVAVNTGPSSQWISQYREAQKLIDPPSRDSTSIENGLGSSSLDTNSLGSNLLGSNYLGNNSLSSNSLTGEAADTPTDPIMLRNQIVRSVLSGSKGIMLRSYSPLNLYTPAARAQFASLRWTINDLALWGPWVVAGQSVRPPTLSRPDFNSRAWMLHNSYLIVAQHNPEQAAAVATIPVPIVARPASTSTTVPASPNTSSLPTNSPFNLVNPLVLGISVTGNLLQVHRVTGGVYEQMETTRSPVGLQWTVNQPQPIEAFVISENPNVVSFVNRHLNRTRTENAEDQLEIAAYQSSIAAELAVTRFGNSPEPQGQVQFAVQSRARRTLEEGLQSLRTGAIPAASASALQSLSLSESLIADAQRVAQSNLAAPQSSPFLLMPAALRYHWKIAEACNRSRWEPLPIAGSDLVSLDAVLQSGWTKQQRLEERAEMRVEWIPPMDDRGPGLRLAAYQKGETELRGGYEGASLRIRSAAAKVRAGQMVRILAKARVRAASPDPASGLLFYDNQAGPGLGQLVRGQPGELKEIELYRFIVEDGELRILAECRGQCDIIIESLQTSVIQPATNERNFPTAPVNPDGSPALMRPALIELQPPTAS